MKYLPAFIMLICLTFSGVAQADSLSFQRLGARPGGSSACPALNQPVAVNVRVENGGPAFYDGQGWRIRSQTQTREKFSSAPGIRCNYVVAADVVIVLSGMTRAGFAPEQVAPDMDKIEAYVTSLIRRQNGAALRDGEQEIWQAATLRAINAAAHAAVADTW